MVRCWCLSLVLRKIQLANITHVNHEEPQMPSVAGNVFTAEVNSPAQNKIPEGLWFIKEKSRMCACPRTPFFHVQTMLQIRRGKLDDVRVFTSEQSLAADLGVRRKAATGASIA